MCREVETFANEFFEKVELGGSNYRCFGFTNGGIDIAMESILGFAVSLYFVEWRWMNLTRFANY